VIHLIVDNARIHLSPYTRQTIAGIPAKVVPPFLPPYCPEANTITGLARPACQRDALAIAARLFKHSPTTSSTILTSATAASPDASPEKPLSRAGRQYESKCRTIPDGHLASGAAIRASASSLIIPSILSPLTSLFASSREYDSSMADESCGQIRRATPISSRNALRSIKRQRLCTFRISNPPNPVYSRA